MGWNSFEGHPNALEQFGKGEIMYLRKDIIIIKLLKDNPINVSEDENEDDFCPMPTTLKRFKGAFMNLAFIVSHVIILKSVCLD